MTDTHSPQAARLLRRALVANGLFSLTTGAMLALSPATWLWPLFEGIGGALPWARAVGVGLVGFSLLVLRTGAPVAVSRPAALAITGADLLWVLATGALPFAFLLPGPLVFAIGATNMVVLGCAVAQLFGLRRAFRALSPQAH